MDHILGEDLVGRVDQHFGVFRFDPEIRIQRPAPVIIEFLDRRVPLVAGRQAMAVPARRLPRRRRRISRRRG